MSNDVKKVRNALVRKLRRDNRHSTTGKFYTKEVEVKPTTSSYNLVMSVNDFKHPAKIVRNPKDNAARTFFSRSIQHDEHDWNSWFKDELNQTIDSLTIDPEELSLK